MHDQVYPWQRFWCPREGRLDLSDGGYLRDPEERFLLASESDSRSYESIAETPCLILLGEPGIGKSTAIESAVDARRPQLEAEGHFVIFLDLRAYGSEDRLVSDLFQSDNFLQWLGGSMSLYLFLDSLDEALLRINTVAAILSDEIKKLPVERVFLRIACRTAVWPLSLEGEFKALWGQEQEKVGAYELAPLRRVDVIEAIEAHGLDSQHLLEEFRNKEVEPLAAKPITLKFLLNTYASSRSLPQTRAKLYEEGCLRLAKETNRERRETGLKGRLEGRQRLAVAARIAAATVFANRYAIWTDVDLGDVPPDDVTVADLTGGTEVADGNDFKVDDRALRETLDTGLFSSRGPGRMGWAHQSYAEFLAAYYLLQHAMSPLQMTSLLAYPGDPAGGVVPQLKETAAWLASISQDVFDDLVSRDPEVLLRSDVGVTDGARRERLIDGVLTLLNNEMMHPDRLWRFGRKWDLGHSGLAGQLRPYLREKARAFYARRFAIDLALDSEVDETYDDLVSIALDPQDDYNLRAHAAWAVSQTESSDHRRRLKPLAVGGVGKDPRDELKGYGLFAVWPEHLSSQELFQVLSPPKSESFFGGYRAFLHGRAFLGRGLPQGLEPRHLPDALNWVRHQGRPGPEARTFEDLCLSIMNLAWEKLEEPGILGPFAEAALERAKHHLPLLGDPEQATGPSPFMQNTPRRHKLLKALVAKAAGDEGMPFRIASADPALVFPGDTPWVAEQLEHAASESEKQTWAQILLRVFDQRDTEYFDTVVAVYQKHPTLRQTFWPRFAAVELDSPQAKDMRKRWQEHQQWEQRRARPRARKPRTEMVRNCLDAFEAGDLYAWCRLLGAISHPEYGEPFYDEVRRSFEWQDADDTGRARIIEAAGRYVAEHEPQAASWLGTGWYIVPDYDGYRALFLLAEERPACLDDLPRQAWESWAPVVLAYPAPSGIDEEQPHLQLVKMAYQRAPQELIDTLILLVDEGERKHGHLFILSRLELCWDERLAEAVFAKAKDGKLSWSSMGQLLDAAIEHGHEPALSFARGIIAASRDLHENRMAVFAATALMRVAADAGWPQVWPAIQCDPEFGKRVFARYVDSSEERRGSRLTKALSESQIAELYVWLARAYPHADDPKSEAVTGYTGTRDWVADWRHSLLTHLKGRGTAEACKAIRFIRKELPNLGWVAFDLLEAQRAQRIASWTPPTPKDVIRLAHNANARLIGSSEHLLDLVVESLQRYQSKLRQEPAAIRSLWDWQRDSHKYIPVYETDLSDQVKSHLKADLSSRRIVVNREVQINRGQETDILVEAIMLGSNGERVDTLSIIVEAKGCWRKEVKSAMETQLVKRYLANSGCLHGLYLVAWFNCDEWDDNDYQKGRAPKWSAQEAQSFFDEQAQGLSEGGLDIRAVVLDCAWR